MISAIINLLLQIMETTSKDPLGKYQKIGSFLWFQLIYFTLYFVTLHLIYAIITLNIYVITFYLVVTILQRKVKRNQKYIDWVNNTMQFRKGVKGTKLILEEDIKPDQKRLFGFHPHGVFATSLITFMNYPNSPLADFRGLSSRFMFNVPVLGMLLRLWGIEPVDGHHMKQLLHNGKNIGLVPGGYEEATLTVQDELRIFINERKGFIKYAMEYNYVIHPLLSLNQHKLYWTFRSFEKIRLWLNKFKLPEVIYWNRRSGPFPPSNMQWIVIVGKGIKGKNYKEGEIPTQEQIDEVHAQYVQQLKRMHQKHQHLSPSLLKIY